RGELGGLSKSVGDAIKILDAFGKEIIIVETIGVGQDEVDITNVGDTIIMVMVPGTGDYIQTLKAGIMEIGDIYVVNKAELIEAEKLHRNIQAAVEMGEYKNEWVPPVLKTSAIRNEGIENVLEMIEQHSQHMKKTGYFTKRRKIMAKMEILKLINDRIARKINEFVLPKETLDEIAQMVADRKIEPHAYVNKITESMLK
ncbi:MAG: hypothetical protein Q7J12_03000, partial [Syntrophales bacterium]|nr:hypothetical protein [Syntrophales bacterium]